MTVNSALSRFAVAVTLTAACTIAALLPAVASAEPLLTRNQNPLTLPYGLPTPLPARLPSAGSGRFTLDVNWSNSANLESSDDYDFTMDAESQEVRLRLEHAMGSQWAAMIEVPWRNLSGGSLDGFIDNWHDLFGLPQGAAAGHAGRPVADRLPAGWRGAAARGRRWFWHRRYPDRRRLPGALRRTSGHSARGSR